MQQCPRGAPLRRSARRSLPTHSHDRRSQLQPSTPPHALLSGPRTAQLPRRQLLANLLVFPALGLASTLHPSHATAVEVLSAPPEELVEPPPSPSTSSREGDGYHTPFRITATGRVVAIGDLHGDWVKAVESLVVAGVVTIMPGSEDIVWSGGDTVVVQLGDVMDRGDNEIAIVMLLRNLHEQAQRYGGAVYMLNGNHESLNICGDFRYVTPGAFMESAMFVGLPQEQLHDRELLRRVRSSVYRPGGPMALELSRNPTVLMVNDTVFAHGGLLPVHINYGLERLNQEVSAWMRGDVTPDGGKALPPYLAMGGANSIMWNRSLSREVYPNAHEKYVACRQLRQSLEKIGGSRLVVGHTPQLTGANCECEGQVWRIDIGMSSGVLNRPVQVLEIVKDPATGKEQVAILDMPGNYMEEEQSTPL